MTSDPIGAAIVQATIQLAHSVGIRVVAEGIEDQVTWNSLAAKRCKLVQGYAPSKPLPAAELACVLATLWRRRIDPGEMPGDETALSMPPCDPAAP
jgi:EAL domain-containing protein (putative c-di-GMP-specific phosphodiesterase class I)